MTWRTSLSALVASALIACSPEAPVDSAPQMAPISGAQIDSMRAAIRAHGLAPAEWANVLLRDAGTRAVVHARPATDLEGSEQEAFCATVRTATSPLLEPGQRLEIYVIRTDDVAACF